MFPKLTISLSSTGIFISIFGEGRAMKTVLKSLVVGLMVFALSFSPALAGLAKAGGFNFEGISPIKTDDTQSYEKQPRGLMFNFSFGGPKDYKKTESQIAMMNEGKVTTTTEENLRTAVGVVIVLGIMFLIIDNNNSDSDDNDLWISLPPNEN
jgi:hypothetical protein